MYVTCDNARVSVHYRYVHAHNHGITKNYQTAFILGLISTM